MRTAWSQNTRGRVTTANADKWAGRFRKLGPYAHAVEFIDAAPPAKPDDFALLMYTSGTTGIPKAVPLTHGNIYAESDKIQEVMHISDQEVLFSLLPLFHNYSQIVNLWLATIVGGRVIYLTELIPVKSSVA